MESQTEQGKGVEVNVDDRKARIKFILMDVDGTLTDGRIYCGPSGEVMKVFHAQDSSGFALAREHHIGIGWGSGKASTIARNRATALGIQCYYDGVKHKDEGVKEIAKRFRLELSEICFIGDDTNDIPAMQICGLSIAVCNAVHAVKDLANYVTASKGGEGAVREAIEWLVGGW